MFPWHPHAHLDSFEETDKYIGLDERLVKTGYNPIWSIQPPPMDDVWGVGIGETCLLGLEKVEFSYLEYQRYQPRKKPPSQVVLVVMDFE